MESSTIFPLVVSVIFCIWAAWKLYSYSMPRTQKRVLFVAYLGFIVSFFCVVLIPFDIDSTLANRYRDFLYYAWRSMYWSLQVLSWVVYPFNMEKERTGSWQKSLQRNAIWWVIYLVVALIAVVYFFGVTNYGLKGMLAVAYAASNTWGLTLIILLAGYGLVAAPQWFYLQSKPKDYLNYMYIKAVSAEDARLAAKFDLMDVYTDARKTMDANDPDLVSVASFLESSYGYAGNDRKSTSSGESTHEADKAVALRDALLTAKRSIGSWKMLVHECMQYEDFYGESGDTRSVGRAAKMHKITRMTIKIFSILGGVMSALVILGQSTIFIDVWWLSILAVIFRAGVWNNPGILETPEGSFISQALLTVPLLWVYYCCYWSLTRIKLAKFYGLYRDHQTDTISLMWCGGMLIRIAFPLVYNYLFVLRIPDHPATVFEEMQGWMDIVPLLGDSFVKYFPLFILVVALLTLSNTYSKIMGCLGLGSLQFESTQDTMSRSKLIEEGKALILREREGPRGSARPSVTDTGLGAKMSSSKKYEPLSEEPEEKFGN
jgi:hypothetical protein